MKSRAFNEQTDYPTLPGQFDTCAACQQIKVPLGGLCGNPRLAAGMCYCRMLETLR
jgi:hypothetical protein